MSAGIKRVLRILVCGLVLGIGLYAQEGGGEASKENANAAAEESRTMWRWVNFVIMAAFLGYLIGKSAPKMFRDRTSEIQKGIAEAQQVKQDAERRAADMDARMSRLGADIEAFRAQAKADMDQEGERIRKETATQMEHIQQQSAAEIEAAGKTARRELREYAANLALDMAAQRIGAKMSPATDAAIIAGFLKDLEHQGSKN